MASVSCSWSACPPGVMVDGERKVKIESRHCWAWQCTLVFRGENQRELQVRVQLELRMTLSQTRTDLLLHTSTYHVWVYCREEIVFPSLRFKLPISSISSCSRKWMWMVKSYYKQAYCSVLWLPCFAHSNTHCLQHPKARWTRHPCTSSYCSRLVLLEVRWLGRWAFASPSWCQALY